MKFTTVKGTRDILPDEIISWRYVENVIHDTMVSFNYKEIRTPLFEKTELFARSIGEHTDIVTKEMYTFKDHSKTKLTLKPELTAPVVRAYIQHNLSQLGPLAKLYYIAPLFRQERPQAGRFRQFHQYGVEAIGSPYPEQDVELILLAKAIYERIGISGYTIKLNSVGDPVCRKDYVERLKKALKPSLNLLCKNCRFRYDKNPMRIFDCKEERCREIFQERAPVIADFLCENCKQHFEAVKRHLDDLGFQYTIDPHMVRGLDYYTSTTFEFISKELGAQDALCGGGRYDLLVQELGGKPTPAAGFAAGIERLLMVMNRQQIKVQDEKPLQVFIIPMGVQFIDSALRLIDRLRNKGFSCEMDHLRRSLKSQMREANRQKVKFTVIIGDEEMKRGTITVKNMENGVQESIPEQKLEDYLLNTLKK